MEIGVQSFPTLIPLDPLQIELDGIHLIEASAGTGKTYTIATLFIRLLIEKQLRVDQILVVTFTEAATQELRAKIRERLLYTLHIFQQGHCDQEDSLLTQLLSRYTYRDRVINQLIDAIRNFDEAAIFTIHSFCRQMLQNNAFESNTLFDVELVKEQMPFLKTIVTDFWRQYIYHYPPSFVQYLAEQGYKQPDDLLPVLNKGQYVGQPLLTIIPQNQEINSVHMNVLVQQFQEKLHLIRQLWLETRQEIEQLLTSHPSLKQTSYKKENIPTYCHIMNNFLISSNFYIKKDELQILAKFTISNLESGTKKNNQPPKHEFFQQWSTAFSLYQDLVEQFAQTLLQLKIKLLHYANTALEQQKQKYNIQFFNDLLTNLYFALQSNNGTFLAKLIRKYFPVALIDEFQDTDPVQYEIFRQIYAVEKHVLFLIGDPKQAIYSFRGADIFAYMTACQDAKQRHTLTMNWRSETELVQAINTLFTHQTGNNPFLFKEITFHPVSPSPQKEILQCLADKSSHLQIGFISRELAGFDSIQTITKERAYQLIPEFIVAEIKKLLFFGETGKLFIGKKAVGAGDITILVRKHQQAYLIQHALLKAQIPSVVYSDDNLFETNEVTEIERVLLACVEPTNESLLKAALTTDMLGVNAYELHYLIEKEDLKWQHRIKSFSRYHSLWKQIGFIQMFHTLLAEEQVVQRLLTHPNGERRLTNVLHIIELLQQASKEYKLDMAALCHWLAQKRHFIEENQVEHQLRLESDENRVKIYTIHRSKGLEFNIVFCPFLWDGHLNIDKNYFTFHKDGQLVLDVGSNEQNQHLQQAQEEIYAENMRLCYVALTRAKHRCYVVWGSFKDAEQSPLSHLLHRHFEQKTPDEQLWVELKELEIASNHAVEIIKFTQEAVIFSLHKPELPILQEKKFTGKIAKSWKVTSFSALTQATSVDKPDYDRQSIDYSVYYSNTAEVQPSIFTFPRGAKAGQFVHELFETIDFTQVKSEHIMEKLQQFNYDTTRWFPIITQLITNVTTTPLLPSQCTLSQIPLSARLTELEFYYPLNHISVQGLQNIFAHFEHLAVVRQLMQQLNVMNFVPLQGMMKGYIDLIFEHQNKFYIIDYKSNFLGYEPENYAIKSLRTVMLQELYFLQYYIYTVALHRYLSVHLKNYQYSQHIGGVYYLFVRGIQPNTDEPYGIYHDLPDYKLIQKLSNYFYQ